MADHAPPAPEPADAPAAPGVTDAIEPTSSTSTADDAAPEEQNGDVAVSTSTPLPAAADASGSKDKKRKSVGGVPEHKTKKLNKKKSMPVLHLNCKPGEYYWARLKGYPPWPSIICDESMLPETLLATRPVSTAGPDGSIRADFEEGGKNAKERTFPIMFLETNEFQWMVNTALTPLDPAECAKPTAAKMAKSLKGAYDTAAQNHNLDYYKELLKVWQDEEESFAQQQAELDAENARLAEEQAKAELEAKSEASKEKTKKKAPRKSKAADEDVVMEDAEVPKSSKKRKKDAESDAEGPQQKKTPKITKLNAPKTPNGDATASNKKTATKSKKKVVVVPKEEETESKPQMTEADRLAQREKFILYLRHRLQKGFLSRDHAPKESEMAGMAEFFAQLESCNALEPSIIRTTKIHKVLKAIIKLASVPKDGEYNFKKRSAAMLELWNTRMEAEGGAEPTSTTEPKSVEPETNGVHAAEPDIKLNDSDAALEQKDLEMKDADQTKEGAEAEKTAEELEVKAEKDDAAGVDVSTEKSAAPAVETSNGDQDEADVDISMQTAPEEATT